MQHTDYSAKVIDHFMNPRNMGELDGADAVGTVGSPACGDMMDIYLKVEDDRIVNASFKTFGCTAAIANSSMMTEMVKGMRLDDAENLKNRDIEAALDGLPPHKIHCSTLAADALHEAIKSYRDQHLATAQTGQEAATP
jgi:nitrogen fixation NifU-like protein